MGYLNPKAKDADVPILEDVPSVYDWPEDFKHLFSTWSLNSKVDADNVDPKLAAIVIGVSIGRSAEAQAS